MIKECPIWDKTNILWSGANWTWDECKLVEEIVNYYAGVDASLLQVKPYEELEPEPLWMRGNEKKKKVIRLICKVKGEVFDESKEIKDIKVKVDDIKLVVKTISGIELNIK